MAKKLIYLPPGFGKDPTRYPKIQLRYEGEMVEDYKKTIKVIKALVVTIIK